MKSQNYFAKSKASKTKRGINILKPVHGDAVLIQLTGLKSGARCEYVRQIWGFIKKHKLQSKNDGRIITPNKDLAKLMGVEGQKINAFTMTRYIEQHLIKKWLENCQWKVTNRKISAMQIFCAHYSTIDLLKVQIIQIRIKELLLIFCIISVSHYD